MSIAIIDYGVGNLFSLNYSLRYLGLKSAVTRDPAALEQVDTDLRIVQTGQVSTEPSV